MLNCCEPWQQPCYLGECRQFKRISSEERNCLPNIFSLAFVGFDSLNSVPKDLYIVLAKVSIFGLWVVEI